MYTSKVSFTSKHKHVYYKGQKITDARYLFLSSDDKNNFEKYIHGIYESHQENDPNYGHPANEYYYPNSDLETGITVGLIVDELINDQPQTDISVQDPQFQGFDGGSGGGGGAAGSWTPDVPSPEPAPDVFVDPTPDPIQDYSKPDSTPDYSVVDTPSYDSPSYDSPSDAGSSFDN